MNTISIKNVETDVLDELTRLNVDGKDNHLCSHIIGCAGIACRDCPLLDDVYTLGDVRAELANRESGLRDSDADVTESHKGGGGGPYHEYVPPQTPSINAAVYNPKHYEVIEGLEAIEIIARSMTVEQFKGYTLGNIIKYRMRLGSKDSVEQDLKKAQNYKDIFEKHKELCYDYSK